ncbi:serine/threonine-protein kinase brsk2-like protein [Anaeramoeba flamelloides]|uniref:non-specific serine/threonine protein kinase n=1 Tax=Anaeramoeba flamelloides TaxID=1746091 RepID=A0AAV7ZTR4_9EUKA|nr:serine/threonine-protein kinase brsk2-like protein [Anaeramoeba flamelloides]
MSLLSIGPYEIGKTLGTGSYSKVKLATHKVTGQKVAIKIVSKKQLLEKPANLERIRREISVQKLIKHPSVIQIYDVYETNKHLFLVLEYISGGELFDYIVECERVPPDEARKFFQQIIYAIEHIHSFSITHRDLKPENLLLDRDNNIKIIDFGMAKIMESGNLLQTACGSPHYIAPEVLKGKGYDGQKSDIWACGVVLYALLCGYLPFDEKKYQKLLYKIKKGKYSFPPNLDEQEMDLISKMLTVNPKKRITIKEIKKHPWFIKSFPQNYLPPTPPIDYGETLKKPISPRKIDLDIVEEIEQLGWIKNKQIMEGLQSDESNTIKVFYTFFQKYKSQNQSEDKEEKSVGSSKRRKSLPSKKRRNSLTRSRKSTVVSPSNKKNAKKGSPPRNVNGTSPIEKEMILKLQEFVEKTDKQNDLDVTEFSEILTKINSFQDDQNLNTENYFKKRSKEKLSKNDNKKKKKKRSMSLRSNPISRIAWGNTKDSEVGNNNNPKNQTKGKTPVFLDNEGNSYNEGKKKQKKKKKTKKNRKKKSTNKKKNALNLSVKIPIEKKQTQKNPKFSGLTISINSKNETNKKEDSTENESNSTTSSGNKDNKSYIDEEELFLMGIDQIMTDRGNQGNKSTPRFHRKKGRKKNRFQVPQTPTQEEFGFGSKRWFDEFVSKKEQKKLNNELKKQLKKAKNNLMKNMQQNENLPVFICNNRIIAVSSGSLLSAITELQTAFTICNYSWDYPNFCTLNGQNGKFSIKVKIQKTEQDLIIEQITNQMINQKKIKKKKKKNSLQEEKENIQKKVFQKLKDSEQSQKRNWNLAIEFVWKNGSAKKFIEETENLIHFLSE